MDYAKKSVVEDHRDYLNYIKLRDFEEIRNNDEYIEKVTSLAISFYNVGVEEDHFDNYQSAF